MTLKDLHGAIAIWKEIDELKEKLEKAHSAAQKITAFYSLVPSPSKSGDGLARTCEMIVEYEMTLVDRYCKVYEEKLRLQRFFSSVEDPVIRTALELKYDPDEGTFLSWLQVAQRIYGGGATADSIRMACKRYVESL